MAYNKSLDAGDPFNAAKRLHQASSGNLLDDLRKYLDIFTDYATIRIYWKFYRDPKMSVPAEGNHDPRNLQKGYYLFINKT